MIPFLVTIGILVLILISGFRIAQEYKRGVVFRLGRYQGLRSGAFLDCSSAATIEYGMVLLP